MSGGAGALWGRPATAAAADAMTVTEAAAV
jgi:hypothetical protein